MILTLTFQNYLMFYHPDFHPVMILLSTPRLDKQFINKNVNALT